jgi:hypothetical protein
MSESTICISFIDDLETKVFEIVNKIHEAVKGYAHPRYFAKRISALKAIESSMSFNTVSKYVVLYIPIKCDEDGKTTNSRVLFIHFDCHSDYNEMLPKHLNDKKRLIVSLGNHGKSHEMIRDCAKALLDFGGETYFIPNDCSDEIEKIT